MVERPRHDGGSITDGQIRPDKYGRTNTAGSAGMCVHPWGQCPPPGIEIVPVGVAQNGYAECRRTRDVAVPYRRLGIARLREIRLLSRYIIRAGPRSGAPTVCGNGRVPVQGKPPLPRPGALFSGKLVPMDRHGGGAKRRVRSPGDEAPVEGETAAFDGPHDFDLGPLEVAQIFLTQPTPLLEERTSSRSFHLQVPSGATTTSSPRSRVSRRCPRLTTGRRKST